MDVNCFADVSEKITVFIFTVGRENESEPNRSGKTGKQ
jgi:hypothetical protein